MSFSCLPRDDFDDFDDVDVDDDDDDDDDALLLGCLSLCSVMACFGAAAHDRAGASLFERRLSPGKGLVERGPHLLCFELELLSRFLLLLL